MDGMGLYRMLQRRADQAKGYKTPSRYHPHLVPSHTFANDWLSNGGSEGDLMRLAGRDEHAYRVRRKSDANRRLDILGIWTGACSAVPARAT